MAQSQRPPRGLGRRELIALLGGVSVGGLALGGLLRGDLPVPVASWAALPGPRLPRVLPCLGWAAREPTQPVTVVPARPDKILVHHTASPNERDNALSLGELARAIQRSHIEERGWIDSGHNFLVNRAGLIAEGRHRSLEMLLGGQHLIQGAHCTGQNSRSIGIENEGTYTEADPPTGQLATLRALCAFSCLQYRVRPSQIYGHRDFADTACPGDRLYAILPSLRVLVTRLLLGSPPLAAPPRRPSPAARAALPAPGAARLGVTGVPGAPGVPGVPGAPATSAVPRPGRRPVGPSAAVAPFGQPGVDPLEPGYLEPHVVSPPTWPLLRIADRGPNVLAAQHLLRSAGMTGVPADGAFGRTTADGVFAFQRAHGLDLTGMIGGASWPLLAVPVRIGQGGEADVAAQVLLRFGPGAAESVPRTVQRETWQRLLGTG